MKTSLASLIIIAALAVIPGFHFANAATVKSVDAESLNTLARRTISTDPSQSAKAIEHLRAVGPAGLDAMLSLYADCIEAKQKSAAMKGGTAKDPEWEQLRTALDTVGQQRDCYASHLYWFTDLEQAKSAARASGKPILSLRLLGKLNEEYSCANSRFFRTTLYPNTEVSQYLRDHFILHWQSVRPVPRITIDMGDGRRIERTITGNSIHYVLDTEGNPIDALPGLYGAKTFLAELSRAFAAEQQVSKLSGTEREALLKNYHSTRLSQIQRQWAIDLAKIDPTSDATLTSTSLSPLGLEATTTSATVTLVDLAPPISQTPDAIAAAPRAFSKGVMEVPLLRAGAQPATSADRARLDAMSTDSVWSSIAALHRDAATIDPVAYSLIQFKQPPTAAQATVITGSKRLVESPMVRMIRNLQQSIAEDTVRNEYQLHSRIHEWFANGTAPANLNALNTKIYAELFLTPDSDAWLGLAPADVFSALDGGGLVQNTTH